MSEADVNSVVGGDGGGSLFMVAGQPEGSFLRTVLETLPDAMVLTDEAGVVLCFNPGAERMFGYAEGEIVGRNVSVLMRLPGGLGHDDFIETYLRTGRRNVIGTVRPARGLHRSGKTFPIDLAIGEAVVDGRRVFTGFMHDLSEREAVLERLRMQQAELSQVSRISSLGLLASAIAHELNQPLSAIGSYAETVKAMLEEGRFDAATTLHALDHCAAEVQRAGAVIRGLRGFLARGDVERRSASLGAIIDDAVTLALIDGEGEGVELDIDYDMGADTVVVDRVQVQQVVFNLLRNAKEAMAGQALQMIRISTAKCGDGCAEIVVADNGAGIAPSIAGDVFRPFLTTKGDGMGIGLSICETIVEGHGGKIWTQPSALGGAAFHFTLPLASDEAGGAGN